MAVHVLKLVVCVHADANLADEGTNTGQGYSSRAASDAPSTSGHRGAKTGKRSRSITPEGGLAAQHFSWDDGSLPLKPEAKVGPVKSEWQGFATDRGQDHGPGYDAGLHDAGTSQNHHHTSVPDHNTGVEDASGNGIAAEQQMTAAKQEHKPAADHPPVKRTSLKVKLKFKNG